MGSVRVNDLLVHVWPAAQAGGPVAVAAHGITANGLAWARVAQLLDRRVTLVAPDLRGRAGSRAAPGPYGIRRHADDLAAVLDGLGLARAVFVGHSMGAYVAAVAAVRHPARVSAVVLVDGGLSFPVPAGVDGDAVLHAVLGPAMARLDMSFPDREAYRRYWQAHPALTGHWAPWVDDYIQHDLVGEGPYRSSCVVEAVRVDGGEVFADAEVHSAIHQLPVPGVLLWAPRGLQNEEQGLYDERRLAGLALPTVRVPDTNHYTLLLDDAGAGVVAEHIVAAAQAKAAGPPAESALP
ncbi:MAG TPA: alpha/beta fold hydrolase [Micromonosporaceae bacterium]|nr:alpha/beta fold hydrolase [Micromonosporaceae bacterium]